jgi:hypothetical protein
MEKCPPAEACRDAFERMSKATVQMCLSTPGFGFSRERDSETPRPVKRESTLSDTMPLDIPPRADYTPIAPKPRRLKRPPPQFDMDLRGLFPEDLDSNVRPSSSFPADFRRRARQPSHMQQYHPTPGQTTLPVGSPASSIGSQIHSGLGMGQSIAGFSPTQQTGSHNIYSQSPYTPDFMDLSTLPGMDFLNLANPANASSAGVGNNDEMGNEFASGLDIGFGVGNMGLDFQHDWSDGQQFDLFDGFFFGNNGMTGGNGGA